MDQKYDGGGKASFARFEHPEVEIIRKPHLEEFCIFKNIDLSRNDLGRELLSLFFHFFIFYANL